MRKKDAPNIKRLQARQAAAVLSCTQPEERNRGKPTYSNINDCSIVVRITHGNNTFLFTGDAEWDAEHDMVDSGYDLSAAVLKVGHHGSDTSSSYVFLREVMPKYAVISCGKDNSYGHPTEAVLSRLRDVSAQIFRTDLQGDVVFVSDGTTLSFGTEKYADTQMLWKSGGVTN